MLNDAHLEDTVTNIIGAAFGSAGERCMACAVVTVEEESPMSLWRNYRKKQRTSRSETDWMTAYFGTGHPRGQQNRTHSYIEKGIEEGAKLLCDGREHVTEDGYFVGPTIFDNVTTDMTIWKDEIFAPVLSVMRVKNLKEAVDIANQSEFANGACLFTSNANAIRYFRENIDAGMLGINLGVPAPMAFFPFSGWKSSFFGTLHANGKDSVDFYTRKKS